MSVHGIDSGTLGKAVVASAADCSKQPPMPSTSRRAGLLRELAQPRNIVVGAQMLFVAFSGLVLVPVLMGLDASVALFTAGAGTLLFQLVTGARIPVFLASSFAFIAPTSYGIQQFGLAETLGGLMAAGVFYVLLAQVVRWRGDGVIQRLLPAIVTGPVVMVIGMSLAPIAVEKAGGNLSGDHPASHLLVASAVFLVTVLTAMLSRGTWRLIPVLIGIVFGYGISLPLGLIDLSNVATAPWWSLPGFTTPRFSLPAILFILPVAIAPAIEHVGDILAIGAVTGENYLKRPGLQRTLLGDGLATSLAAALGGPPNTTYSEVVGAVALIRAVKPVVMIWAALFAIGLSFVGKLNALLNTIPDPVMGGVLVILFGTIVTLGINTLVRAGADLSDSRNLIVVGTILVLGIGGLGIEAGRFSLEGLSLAAIAGVLLNLALPRTQAGRD
ncbi:uracil-xanthine permease family protein [Synechococcus sp. CS-197]|uniref:uracil-xanthine permease family protein n=1 Tax=Synechococcus sp. CS-197 TaxID=2847985 RepID=UPI00223A9BD4|nr:uracil-xanthine permease family protein [Synechococcus sp. CS-197]